MASPSAADRNPIIAFLATQFDEAYQHEVWCGAAEAARASDAALVFYECDDIALTLAEKHAFDALVVVSNSMGNALSTDRVAELLDRFAALPRVSIGIAFSGVPSVCAENAGGIRTLAAHLLDVHTRRRFLFLAGPAGHPEGEARLAEFLALLDERAPGAARRVVRCDFSEERAYRAVRGLFDSRAWEFDAVVAANDQMALGAVRALGDRGAAVPLEVSVTGYDDVEDCLHSIPPLTTVHQPAAELGRRAVRLAAAALGGHLPASEGEALSARCVIRESCGCTGAGAPQNAIDTERRLRYQVSLRAAAENRIRLLRTIESSLVSSFSLEGILREVSEGCGRLGISYCALAVFDPPAAGVDQARLMLLLDGGEGRVLAPYGFRFRTAEFVPGGLPRERGPFVLEPLRFDGERLGYLICSADSPDRHAYGALRDQVSTALKGALLMEAERDRERLLESEVRRRTAELSFANGRLHSEIEQRAALEREILDISNQIMSRIGRDIHDEICQDFAGIGVMAATLGGSLRRSGLSGADHAARISAAAADASLRAKRVARELYPESLEAGGLAEAVKRLVESRRSPSGPALELDVHEDFFVRGPEKALHLFRIVQESLNNAIRHSGASCIVVGLYIDREMVTVEVSDDGRGISPDRSESSPDGGMGLRILKYRANVIGARLRVKSDGGGTLVSCRVSR